MLPALCRVSFTRFDDFQLCALFDADDANFFALGRDLWPTLNPLGFKRNV